MKIAIDSSVLIASLIPEEEFHSACRNIFAASHDRFVHSHAFVETFSTLTGGRLIRRITAVEAERMIGVVAEQLVTGITLSPKEIMRTFASAESRGVRGGAIFDYLHLAAARKAGADQIVTLNLRHFQAFWRTGDPLVVHPGER